jgi:hypothetical protein
VSFGLGQDSVKIDPSDVVKLLQTIYADMLIYSAAVALIKLSAILLYARIFPGREFRWMLWGMGAFVICWLIAVEFAFAFQCTPVPFLWNHQLEGTCLRYAVCSSWQRPPRQCPFMVNTNGKTAYRVFFWAKQSHTSCLISFSWRCL